MMIVRPSSSRSFMRSWRISPRTDGVQVGHRLVGDDHLGIEDHARRRSPRVDVGHRRARAGRAGRTVPAAAALRSTAPWLTSRSSVSPFGPAVDVVDPQGLGDDLVDRLAGVQRAGRVLEHHLDRAPIGLEVLGQRLAFEQDATPASTGCSPMIARAVVVLPQPDSPASASTSPRLSSNDTPSTARDRAAFLPRSPAIKPDPSRGR